jgi:hypothetical protein
VCRPAGGLRFPQVFRIKYAWRTGWGSSGKSQGTPVWKLGSIAFKDRWPTGWTSGGMNSGAVRRNPWTVGTSRYGRWQRGWWEFPLLHPPLQVPWGLALSDSEKGSPGRQSWGSVSAGE